MKTFRTLLLLLMSWQCLQAQLPQGFTDELVSSGWSRLISPVFDSEGRGFAWSQSGRVWRLDDTGQPLTTPLLNISEEVADWLDMGMLGMALDPNFTENGHFYLLYVMDRHHLFYFGTPQYDPNVTVKGEATIGRITRFTADKATDFTSVVPGSRKVLLGETKENGFPILYSAHGVGALAFGTDGTLLASCGETAYPDWADLGSSGITYFEQALADGIIKPKENVGAYRSQLVDCLSGKILRIDPETGDGLPSNPFFDTADPGSARSKVWALGFRNPFRFVVKPNSGSHFPGDGDPGDLYVGDVGANHWEELCIVTEGGQNFGWPMYEGFEERTDFSLTDVANLDAPNPLAGTAGCSQTHFFFRQLLAPSSTAADTFFTNPCLPSEAIPASIPVFLHSWPVLAYRNKDDAWGPFAFVSTVDSMGRPTVLPIDDPTAAVIGAAHFQGTSSMAGLFLNGENWPQEYQGQYFHVDFNGWIRRMDVDAENQLYSIESFHNDVKDIICLVENPKDDCLYYLDIKDQELRKICYGGSPAPVALAKADQYFGPSPLEVHFDGSGSLSPTGSPLQFHWDFGDGTWSNEQNPTHVFVAESGLPKPFKVKFSVTDSIGQERSSQLIVSLNNTPPQAAITSVADSSKYALDHTTLIRLEGEASDKEFAEEALTFQWRTYLHHDTHFHSDLTSDERRAYAYLSPLGCGEEPYWYRLALTVTDPAGLSTTVSHHLFPYCGDEFYELVELKATAQQRTVTLNWTTILEHGISDFEIERGSHIFDFSPIGKITASNLEQGSKYLFTDYNPHSGIAFYRLKINRLDGTFSYSAPVVVTFAEPMAGFAIYPNPANKMLRLAVDAPNGETITFRLFNIFGALMKNISWQATPGKASTQQLSVEELPAGLYFYEFDNNGKQQAGTLLIHR